MSTVGRALGQGILLFCALTTAPLIASEFADIGYTLDRSGRVSAAIYDSDGRMVRTLLRGAPHDAGTHRLGWDGLDRQGRKRPWESFSLDRQRIPTEYLYPAKRL